MIRREMRRKIFVALLGMFLGIQAHAAQVAEVIVSEASVYQYPQGSSKVISKLGKGESIAVSNIPTEGFYKVRLKNGDMGWVSGNDILSGGGGGGPKSMDPSIPPAEPRARKRPPQRRFRPTDDEESADTSGDDSFRLLVGYGMSFLSYGGLKDNFDKVSGLGTGKHFGVEAQFKMSRNVYWGIRLESLSSSASADLDTTYSQSVQVKEIPVEIGIIWSPITSHKFRFGLGAYLGATPSSSAAIVQVNKTTSEQKNLEYSTIEMCGEISAQMVVGLGERIGIFVEGDYRYDQTGKNPDTTVIRAIPGFKIDYSGVLVRGGLEFRL